MAKDMRRKSTNVLVTGVGGRSFGAGIMFALRILHPKYDIIGTDADSFSFGLYKAKAHNIKAIFAGTIPEGELWHGYGVVF